MQAPVNTTNHQPRISIRTKLAVAISLCIGLITLFVYFHFPRALENQALNAMASRAQSIGEMTAFSAAPGLVFEDVEAIREALSVAQQNEDLEYLVVTDLFGNVLASYNEPLALKTSYRITNDLTLPDEADTVYKSSALILHEDKEIGRLYLGLSLSPLRAEVQRSRTSIAWMSVILFILGVGSVVLISMVLVAPLAQITRTAKQIAQGDLSLRTQVRSRDEVGLLAYAFDDMVEKLETAYRDLERKKALEQEIAVRKRTEATLRAAKEKAEEMARLKDAFLANMSHEIRTPLTAIIGLADTLHDEVPDENREFTELIRESGQRLLETLNSVLDLAQIESGGIQMRRTPINLGNLIREIAGMFRRQVADRGLFLKMDLPKQEPLLLTTDHGALTRVLTNLVSNAIKFTLEGGVTIAATADDTTLSFRVIDTGIGIDEAFLPHIFDDFKQESSGFERHYEGNGLGLTITKRLLDLMGGTIEVQSRKGQGSQFIVSFPRSVEQAASSGITPNGDRKAVPPETPPGSTPEQHPGFNGHILVVEDNPESARTIQHVLGAYTTTLATTPDEALALARRESFDMLLLDINLRADRTGTDVLHELRRLPTYAHTPAIALTAYALPNDRERFLQAGFNEYLSKPFRKEELLRTVARLLAQARPAVFP